MRLFIIIALCVLGFVLIAKGGDIFVDSAITIAKKLKMPAVLIGATIVSVGTTLPEILVSSLAAAHGDVGLAVSNATGSIFCNLTLILGVSLSAAKITAERSKFLDKLLFAGGNVLILVLFIMDAHISLLESILLLAMFAAFMCVNIYKAVRGAKKPGDVSFADGENRFTYMTIVMFALGAVSIAIGANVLVDNVSLLAVDYLKIPTAIIGATVVALGTSLPELVTAINSVKKKNADMSLGNVLGANVINGTFLVGFSGALQGGVGMQIATEGGSLAIVISVIAMFIGMLILSVPLLVKKRTYRWQGVALLSMYAAYIIYLVLTAVLRF